MAVLSKYITRVAAGPMNASFPPSLAACRKPPSTWGFQTGSSVSSAVLSGLNVKYGQYLVNLDFFLKHR